jgi:hypothetical protein
MKRGLGRFVLLAVVALGAAASIAVATSVERAAARRNQEPDQWKLDRERRRVKAPPPAGEQRNMRVVGHSDLQGRGAYQPVPHVQHGRILVYIGHHAGSALNPLTGTTEPNGTSIVDATDPAKPVYRHHLPSHGGERQAQMVQVCDGRALPRADRRKTYLLRTNGDAAHEVWDVSEPGRPAMVATVQGGLRSTHKNWWDCATGLAYLVSDGRPFGWRTDRLLQVFDLGDPAAPTLVRNFGLLGHEPGASGPVPPGLHEATALGKRLYLAYGTSANGVMQIVDLDKLLSRDRGATRYDPVKPTREDLVAPVVSQLEMPPFWGGHTAFPVLGIDVPEYRHFGEHRVRDVVVLVSESVASDCRETHHPVFLVDVTVETRPFPIATFQVPESSGNFCKRGGRFGAHSVNWSMTSRFYRKLIFVSYFNAGVRVVDIRDPFRPTEVAFFIPANTAAGATQTNNVEVDDRGYVYLADRAGAGLHIVELTGDARKIAGLPGEPSR